MYPPQSSPFSQQHIIHFLQHMDSDIMPPLSAQPRGLGAAVLKDNAASFGVAGRRRPEPQLWSRPAKQLPPTAPGCARSSVRSSAPSPRLRSAGESPLALPPQRGARPVSTLLATSHALPPALPGSAHVLGDSAVSLALRYTVSFLSDILLVVHTL